MIPSFTVQAPTILGLFPYFGPDSTGGVQLSGRLAWDSLRHTVESRSGQAQLFCYQNGVPRLHHPDAAPGAIIANSKPEAIWLALTHRQNPDLILVWHVGLLKLLPFLQTRSARVVLFLHSVEVWQPLGWLTRILLGRVDLFLSNSTISWHHFLKHHPWLEDRPHETVHLGMGAPSNQPTDQPTNQPTALILSRLSKGEDYKGHRELIAAWPRILRRIPDARLWIAGEGDLRPDLEHKMREMGLQDHVRFWGWVSEEKKQELLQQCHCFAMPSRGEGFGLVYLEAMRLGRPCLVSTLDAGREVVNPPEAGLAADPRDPQALADAACRLLTPGPEWDRWSHQARRRYESQFTAQHFQERLVSVLFGSGS